MNDGYENITEQVMAPDVPAQATVTNIMGVAALINQFNGLFWLLQYTERSPALQLVVQATQQLAVAVPTSALHDGLRDHFRELGEQLLRNNVDVDGHVNDLIAKYHEQQGTGI